jgi:hypothetical protein
MPPQSRRSIRSDFRLPIDVPGAVPAPPPWARVPGVGPAPTAPPAAGPTSGVTRMLDPYGPATAEVREDARSTRP